MFETKDQRAATRESDTRTTLSVHDTTHFQWTRTKCSSIRPLHLVKLLFLLLLILLQRQERTRFSLGDTQMFTPGGSVEGHKRAATLDTEWIKWRSRPTIHPMLSHTCILNFKLTGLQSLYRNRNKYSCSLLQHTPCRMRVCVYIYIYIYTYIYVCVLGK